MRIWKPLKEFQCDTCREVMPIDDAYVIWWRDWDDSDLIVKPFNIIHVTHASPNFRKELAGRRLESNTCYPPTAFHDNTSCLNDTEVQLFGIESALHFLETRKFTPETHTSLIEYIRRVGIPFYEQARFYLNHPTVVDEFREFAPYRVLTAERLRQVLRIVSAEGVA